MLKIYNTLTRKTEAFHPPEDRKVKMYTCGPSTYQRPHIGNYRTFLFEDILQRYLEYSRYSVTRLIALTDIEDKAIAQAEEEGISLHELTARNEEIFFNDFRQLSIKRPDFAIRASTIVEQAVSLIKALLEKRVAYEYIYQGAKNVYYDPLKFSGFGKLAHLDMNKWPKKKRRFHLDTYHGMPWNKGDFVLWHGCKENQKVCWDTEIGWGRPAWNIQDAAMVIKHLGFTIDVACGGIDNLVRHHDYIIAVVEVVSEKPFAKYWLHGGHLYVKGKKMSKSKGNVLYLDDLASKGYTKEQIRFFLIYRNYREKLNFTWQNLDQASKELDHFRSSVQNLLKTKSKSSTKEAETLAKSLETVFQEFMDEDLDVPSAFDALNKAVNRLNHFAQTGDLSEDDAQEAVAVMRRIDGVLQVIFEF